MGLDSYIFSTKKSNQKGDFSVKDFEKLTEIAYWRKFWGLQNYMMGLAIEKGYDSSDTEPFLVRLNKNDIDKLCSEARELTDKDSCNSFFDWDVVRKSLFEAIGTCYTELDNDMVLYYHGSW